MLPLDTAIYVATKFVTGGQIALFRIIYALLGLFKDEFMKISSKEEVFGVLRETCAGISVDKLIEKASEVKMSTSGMF